MKEFLTREMLTAESDTEHTSTVVAALDASARRFLTYGNSFVIFRAVAAVFRAL